MARPGTRTRPTRRPGFTLVELLVVIVIIGILIALIAPAIFSAIKTAREAAVTAEENSLANSLATFKDKYGDYPLSRVVLNETGYYNTASTLTIKDYGASPSPLGFFGDDAAGTLGLGRVGNPDVGDATIAVGTTDLTYGQLAQRSLNILRKFFPRATFSSSAAIYTTNSGWHDFNGWSSASSPGPQTQSLYLQGNECLAFFLGGIPNHSSPGTTMHSIAMEGFARDPVNPFKNSTVTTSRNTSFYEFKADRLLDDDGDGIPGYADSLGTSNDARYYAYFSANGTNGYDPNDVNFTQYDSTGTTVLTRTFQVNFNANGANVVQSAAPNPYTTSDPTVSPAAFVNPNSFQIISAGRDRNYGIGGMYAPNGTTGKLPLNDPTNATPQDATIRSLESDNLTNFATGKLE